MYTVYQLLDMTNDWNARPFEEFYTTIPKQQVQFPSITVCPSGKEYGICNNNLNNATKPWFSGTKFTFPN